MNDVLTPQRVVPQIKPPGQPGNDTCNVCYFSTVDAIGIMHCCFYPPAWQRTVHPHGGPPGAPPPSPGGANFAATLNNWPVVDPSNWCGHGFNTATAKWMTPDGARAD